MADDPEQPNRRGRPRVTQPLETQVSTRLQASEYDRLLKIANKSDRTVAAMVRQLILLRLP
jgi:hypothetical protein